jgi:hypothetical protein
VKEGIWRLYRLYPSDEDGPTQKRLVARFVLVGDRLEHLEDHDDILEDINPGERLTDRGLARFTAMMDSPYWWLVSEDDIKAGEHTDLLPEMEGR